jgi:hypothetical protein
MSYRNRKVDGGTWAVVLLFLIIVVPVMVINFNMRQDCLDDGGVWLMKEWVCIK